MSLANLLCIISLCHNSIYLIAPTSASSESGTGALHRYHLEDSLWFDLNGSNIIFMVKLLNNAWETCVMRYAQHQHQIYVELSQALTNKLYYLQRYPSMLALALLNTSIKLWYSSKMFDMSTGSESGMDDAKAEMSLLTRQRQNSCVPGESWTLL